MLCLVYEALLLQQELHTVSYNDLYMANPYAYPCIFHGILVLYVCGPYEMFV
jgi:hypothetical protein